MSVDYKKKYIDIRAKLLESTDVAYRLGYEQGMKEGQQAAQAQAAEQQMMMEQQAAQQGMPPGESEGQGQGMPPEMQGMEEGQGEQAPPEEMEQGGDQSELDSHISELENLVAKGEKPSIIDLRKAVETISGLRKSQKDKWKQKQEQVSSSQKKFVNNLIAKWEKEANTDSVTNELEDVIKQHGISIDED